MSAEAWPTEEMATRAVEAAARKVYEGQEPEPGLLPWEKVPPLAKNQIKNAVLPLVWAALTDLPDPRYAAWEEGLASAYFDFESGAIESEVDNPYPSGV